MENEPATNVQAAHSRKPSAQDVIFLNGKMGDVCTFSGRGKEQIYQAIAEEVQKVKPIDTEAVVKEFSRFRNRKSFFPPWYRPALRSVLGVEKFPSETERNPPLPPPDGDSFAEIKRLLLCDGWPDNMMEYLEKSVGRSWERDNGGNVKARPLHVITVFCDGKCRENDPGCQIKFQLAEYPPDAASDFNIHAFCSGKEPCVFQISGDRVVPLRKLSKSGQLYRPLLSPVGAIVVVAGYESRMNRFFFKGTRGHDQEYRGWAVIWNSDYCRQNGEMKQTYVAASQNDLDLSIVDCWEIRYEGNSRTFKSIGLATNKSRESGKTVNQICGAADKLHKELLNKTYLGKSPYRQIIIDLARRKFFPKRDGIFVDERDGAVKNLLYITASTKKPQMGG